jgi:PAS domain S-box-containing protein
MNDKNKKSMQKKENTPSDPLAVLRRKAEQKLKLETERLRDLFADMQNIVHELGTYQIELEMQNEELRRARAELEESHAKYVDLYDFSPMGYFIFDKKGLIKEVNVTGANMLGMEKRLLRARPFYTFIDPDHRAVFRNHLSEVFRILTSASCEIVIQRSDGAKIHARLHSLSFVLGEGDPGVCRTAIIDVTEQKRAETALRESEERFRGAFENAAVGASMVDQRGQFIKVNRKLCEMLGYSAEELLSKTFSDVTHPEDIKIGIAALEKLTSGRADSLSIEERYIRKDGHVIHVNVSPSAVRDQAGKPIYGLGLWQDITERKRAEEEIQKLNEELKRSLMETEAVNKDLEAFSSSVSHDLRAPLRSIEGFTTGILEDPETTLSDISKDYFQRISTSSRRMSQLIEAMLSMARLTKDELREKTVSLSDLAEVITGELQKKDTTRRVRFVIAKEVKTRGDMDMLRTVLENLLDNAWKFTGKNSSATIEFGATQKEGKTVYFVRDDGAGFMMHYADKLFQPFQRLHSADEFPGIGIGLAMVKRIILRHGGKIWAESTPEQGATFYFTLD